MSDKSSDDKSSDDKSENNSSEEDKDEKPLFEVDKKLNKGTFNVHTLKKNDLTINDRCVVIGKKRRNYTFKGNFRSIIFGVLTDKKNKTGYLYNPCSKKIYYDLNVNKIYDEYIFCSKILKPPSQFSVVIKKKTIVFYDKDNVVHSIKINSSKKLYPVFFALDNTDITFIKTPKDILK
jgi:hypothetical protein